MTDKEIDKKVRFLLQKKNNVKASSFSMDHKIVGERLVQERGHLSLIFSRISKGKSKSGKSELRSQIYL